MGLDDAVDQQLNRKTDEKFIKLFLSSLENCVKNEAKIRIKNCSNVISKILSPYMTKNSGLKTASIFFKLTSDNNLANSSICSAANLDSLSGQFRIVSTKLSEPIWRGLSCYTRVNLDSWPTLLISFLILALLKFIYLNTISIISVMSLLVVCLAIVLSMGLNSLLLNDHSFPVFNLITVAAALSINLFDSFVWSVCYAESRKKSQQQQQAASSADERSVKIVNSTFGQIYYYLWPKNLAFVLILVVVYLNKVQLVQVVSVYFILVLIVYFITSSIAYLIIVAFLSKHHHKFSFSHRIKVISR